MYAIKPLIHLFFKEIIVVLMGSNKFRRPFDVIKVLRLFGVSADHCFEKKPFNI